MKRHRQDRDSDEYDEPTYRAALDWLTERINYERLTIPYRERQLKLDRMRQLLTRLGQPDAGMKIIHVAGTKGKGSTATMIGSVLTAAGFRTGLFSSPHLERVEERFAVDGERCTAAELVALVERLQQVVRAIEDDASADGVFQGGPTYFEITTAMALLHFVERQVDAAVLEVGMGGRLDSTNVCLPAVSVITSISFDHVRQLGTTLTAIAREKAGIIKPGVPVVCGVTEPEPLAAIAEVAREHGCRLIQAGRDFRYAYHRQAYCRLRKDCTSTGTPSAMGALDFAYTVTGQEMALENMPLAMLGRHQAANAAVALATIAELRHQGWCVSTDAMRLGLSHAVVPGRIELVPGEPAVVLDTAHNPASARALGETLAELPRPPRRTLIISISRDKDFRAIIRELVPHFERFIATEYQENPRAVAADRLATMLREAVNQQAAADAHLASRSVATYPAPSDAWHYACQNAVAGELVCIAGSFYLAAEMRRVVLSELSPSPSVLT